MNRAVVQRDWRDRGYSCELFVDPPGQQWNDFVHTTNELVTVVEGVLEMTIEKKSWIVEPGDEVFIPKGAVHSVRNVHQSTTRWLYGYGSV
ncbi:MAG: cupin domain-containing protein [Gammaproteobacteria bacterium]|nr:cupin domain-containing protein [Gammaproteobacteria bacterium]